MQARKEKVASKTHGIFEKVSNPRTCSSFIIHEWSVLGVPILVGQTTLIVQIALFRLDH